MDVPAQAPTQAPAREGGSGISSASESEGNSSQFDAGSTSVDHSRNVVHSLRQRNVQPSAITAPVSSRVLETNPPAPTPPRTALDERDTRAPAHLVLLTTLAAGVGACLSAGVVAILLIADVDNLLPVVAAVCVAVFASILLRVVIATLLPGTTVFGPTGEPHAARNRLRRATRHLTGERAAYVRTSQRLTMLDRDFTSADYEMLLDLDNNSQRLRQFLEGASQETIDRLPTYVYSKPKRKHREMSRRKREHEAAHVVATEMNVAPSGREHTNPPDITAHAVMSDSEHPNIADFSPNTPITVDCDRKPSSLPEDRRAQADTERLPTDIAPVTNSFFPAAMLPDEKVSDDARCEGGETASKCTICLEHFDDGMTIRILPCMHQFMVQCIDPWLLQQAKCPVCKGAAIPDQMDELRAYS